MHKLHAEKKIAGFLGVIDSGEVIEKIAKNKEAKEEEKGRALVIMIGWESKEAHLVSVYLLFYCFFPLDLGGLWIVRSERIFGLM